MFRQTLLCHHETAVRRELDDHAIEALAISSSARQQEAGPEQIFVTPEGFSITTSEPLVAAAMRALAQASPAALDFSVLLATAREAVGPGVAPELVAERLRAVLLHAHLARIVQLHGCPPQVAARPAPRPCASALARAQCAAATSALSSLLHANVRLEGELEPRLLGLLDGTRDRASLLEELRASTARGEDPPAAAQLERALERFAAVGLLSLASS
jgi:hypothetical protein